MTRAEHISGVTYHGRRGAVAHGFRYGVDYVMLDPDAPCAGLRRNRRGLVSHWDRDHGNGRGAADIRAVLAQHQIPFDGPIRLIAQPRVLGHVFNPVSFWLIYHGADLRAVIAEVTNTFGDRHSYLCRHQDLRPITRSDVVEAQKMFHVSPFQDVAGRYRFRFDIRADRIGIWIDYQDGAGGVFASLTGRRQRLTRAAALGLCLRFGSRRVWALIHWQALRLWWKGARYRPRPEPPKQAVSS